MVMARTPHSQSLQFQLKRTGAGTFWDDLAESVIHHNKSLQSIELVYESSVCHDAARMFHAMATILETNRDIDIRFDGDHHNRTFARVVVPKLRMNRFHRGTHTLCHVPSDSVRSSLFGQAVLNCCCSSRRFSHDCSGGNDKTVSHSSSLRNDSFLRLWWLLSRNTDVLVSLLLQS